jgi:hypothetical protein
VGRPFQCGADAEEWLADAANDTELVLALRALAAITGHRAWADATGRPRPLRDVAAEYRRLLHLDRK